MKTTKWFQTSGAFCALMLLGISATSSYAVVVADPAIAVFTSPDQSATIKLTNDGVPILAAEMLKWQFLASGHTYEYMLTLEKINGAVTISPSKQLEVGSYDLLIETAKGAVTVRVYASLSDLPNIVEATAALTGQSERMIEAKLGLLSTTTLKEVQFDLPPVYYEGQTIVQKMPVTPGRKSVWFINGEPVTVVGANQDEFIYTFDKSGDYVLTYIETEDANGKIISGARGTKYIRVVPVPGVTTNIVATTEMTYTPPAGYQKFVWTIDGQNVSTDSTLKHVFQTPGVYNVEVLASSPTEGPAGNFQRIRYITTVNAK